MQINYQNINLSLAAGIAGTLMVFLIIFVCGFDEMRQYQDLQNSYKRTSEIITSLDSILEATEDAETGQRGYIITAHERYLEPYQKAASQIDNLVDNLKNLTTNKLDLADINTLEFAINNKFAELKESIDLRRKEGLASATKLVLTDRGKKCMDTIRKTLNNIKEQQKRILILQDKEQDLKTKHGLFILLAIFCIAMALQIAQAVFIANFLKARKKVESNLKAVQDSMDEGLLQVDTNNYLIYANPAAEKLFGFKFTEVKGKNLHDLINYCYQDGTARSAEDSLFLNVMKTGKPYHESCDYFVKKDGIFIPVEYTSAPIIEKGQITGAVIHMQDISERKEIERRISEFYSTVSHELRTPLTSIRGTLSLMEGGRLGTLPPKALELAKIAHSEAERLIRLINDILDVRKIEAGGLELRFEKTTADNIINETIKELTYLAKESSIHIVSDIQASRDITCDPERIQQVLSNLISNAIKFSREDSKIIVKAEDKESDTMRFSVEDEGSGIESKQLGKLFKHFQQLDSSDSRSKGGIGLGLAICKAIVEEHGGKIGVESTGGKGSIFWFKIPYKMPQMLVQKFHKPNAVLDKKMLTAPKVLLVEDDTHLSMVLKESLEREGFDIISLSTLKETRDYLAAQNVPNVILLDIQLPDGNSLDLLPPLHENINTRDVPVVIITGSDREAGDYADPLIIDWIKKPFEMKRLFSALKLAVKSRPPGKARVLIADDDEATRELIKQQIQNFDVEYMEANDGITAVHLARTQSPDLIILDLAMPSPDGFEVVEILRREKSCSSLLVYTARDLTNNDKQRLKLGLSTYLTKSRTSEEQFINTVKTLLNGLISNTKNTVAPGIHNSLSQ